MGTSASAASQASCTARRESQTTPATDAGGLSITFIERRHHRDAKASGRGARSFFAQYRLGLQRPAPSRLPYRPQRPPPPHFEADGAEHRRARARPPRARTVKIATRAHQTMIWSRVRQVNTAGVLSGRRGRVRKRPCEPRRTGGPHRGTEPRLGPAALPESDRNPAAACRPAAEHLHHRR